MYGDPPKPSIPRSIGHHREWIEACKRGGPTTCNFDYSGTLAEAVNAKVLELIERAVEHAKAEGRATVRPQDVLAA